MCAALFAVKASAAPLAGPYVLAFSVALYRLRTADGQHQLVGQHPTVVRADRALFVAVLGDRQDDRDSAVGVGPDRDPPEDVARLVQPLRLLHRSAAHREGVVPQGPVAYPGLLSEPQLEGERVLAVVGCRNVLHADREQADADLVRIHVPGFDDAVEAGKALTNFGDLWQSASVGQRNRMLQAIYVDLDKREIVGLLPKKNFLGPILSMAERADVTLQVGAGDSSSRNGGDGGALLSLSPRLSVAYDAAIFLTLGFRSFPPATP